jgi:uncharacterized protein YbjQ (UPF0145 family)
MALTINCPGCGNPNKLPAASCLYCDRDFADLPENRRLTRTPEEEAEIARLASGVVLTTAPSLEGFRVAETLEIVSAECAFGMHLLQDLLTELSDVFGGRSRTTQRALREARRTCLLELKKEAAAVGANAVVAVALDYSQLSGGHRSMIFLVASGTAVRVERAGGGS